MAVKKHKTKLSEIRAQAKQSSGAMPTSLAQAVRFRIIGPPEAAPLVRPEVDFVRNRDGLRTGVETCQEKDAA